METKPPLTGTALPTETNNILFQDGRAAYP
jgi:hypothetical protein